MSESLDTCERCGAEIAPNTVGAWYAPGAAAAGAGHRATTCDGVHLHRPAPAVTARSFHVVQRGSYWEAVDDRTGFSWGPVVCVAQAFAGPTQGGTREAVCTRVLIVRDGQLVPADRSALRQCSDTRPTHAWTHALAPTLALEVPR